MPAVTLNLRAYSDLEKLSGSEKVIIECLSYHTIYILSSFSSCLQSDLRMYHMPIINSISVIRKRFSHCELQEKLQIYKRRCKYSKRGCKYLLVTGLHGLAAALKRKPTVARYTLYFSYLQGVCLTMNLAPTVRFDAITGLSCVTTFPKKRARRART
jgi:hypothetical protein